MLFLPLGLLLVRNRPADVGAEVDGEPRLGVAPKAPAAPVGMTLSQALRTPLLWALALAFAFFFYGLFGWTVHAIPYYESVGLSPGWAVALFSIASAAAVLTRLTFGILADRVRNIERAAAILAVFMVVAMLVLYVTAGSTLGLALFVPLFVIGTGGGPMLEPLLLTRSFGIAHFGTILGAVALVDTVGLVISPTVAGAIFDATGTYDWALVMLIGAFGTSSALFWVAGRLRHPALTPPRPALQP